MKSKQSMAVSAVFLSASNTWTTTAHNEWLHFVNLCAALNTFLHQGCTLIASTHMPTRSKENWCLFVWADDTFFNLKVNNINWCWTEERLLHKSWPNARFLPSHELRLARDRSGISSLAPHNENSMQHDHRVWTIYLFCDQSTLDIHPELLGHHLHRHFHTVPSIYSWNMTHSWNLGQLILWEGFAVQYKRTAYISWSLWHLVRATRRFASGQRSRGVWPFLFLIFRSAPFPARKHAMVAEVFFLSLSCRSQLRPMRSCNNNKK